MKTSDWIAIGSAVVALTALGISIHHERRRRQDARDVRNDDLSRAAAASARAHVLELLVTSDAGVRSVLALDRGATADSRLTYLRRTAQQLDVVGEGALARALDALCDRWESAASVDERDGARANFLAEVKSRFGVASRVVRDALPRISE